jgi:hypothetical protein
LESESCSDKFSDKEQRKQHCIEQHKFPQSFQYWDCKPPRNNASKKNSDHLSSKQTGQNKNVTAKEKNNKSKSGGGVEGKDSNDQQNSAKVMEIDQVTVDDDKQQQQQRTGKSNSSKSKSQGESNKNGDKSSTKSRSVPKHIEFGQNQHRAFRNAYTVAINPTKERVNSDNSTVIDMKDMQEALVTSSHKETS